MRAFQHDAIGGGRRITGGGLALYRLSGGGRHAIFEQFNTHSGRSLPPKRWDDVRSLPVHWKGPLPAAGCALPFVTATCTLPTNPADAGFPHTFYAGVPQTSPPLLPRDSSVLPLTSAMTWHTRQPLTLAPLHARLLHTHTSLHRALRASSPLCL